MLLAPGAGNGQTAVSARPERAAAFAQAQRDFYNGRYAPAAAAALALTNENPSDLAAFELRSSALLFQIRKLLTMPGARDSASAGSCGECPPLVAAFFRDNNRGTIAARLAVERDPDDIAAIYALGKLDLNYIWMQVGTLGHRTGWNEFQEARRSLDSVLARDPHHVRAIVARGWVDYMVDTRVPHGVRWLVGGGSRTRALQALQTAAAADTDFFTSAEARFALWDMEKREHHLDEATPLAESLLRDFPDNRDLLQFLNTRRPATR